VAGLPAIGRPLLLRPLPLLGALALTLALLGGPLVAEASANRLSVTRAKRLASDAVRRDFGFRVRMDSCSRRSPHRVTCTFQPVVVSQEDESLNSLQETCSGRVVVALGHETGRIERSTGGVVCGAGAAPVPEDLPPGERGPDEPSPGAPPAGP
jgi:hypothetical protein